MGKVLIKIGITLVLGLGCMAMPVFPWHMVALAMYLADGWGRTYEGEFPPMKFIGVLHHFVALVLTLFAQFFFTYVLAIHDYYLMLGLILMSFGVFYLFGFKDFGLRLLLWMPFWVGWIVLYGESNLENGRTPTPNNGLFAAIMLLGLYCFELMLIAVMPRIHGMRDRFAKNAEKK